MAGFASASAISLALAGAPTLPQAGGVVSLNLCTDELVLLVADSAAIRSVSYLSHLRDETPLWRRARAGCGRGSPPWWPGPRGAWT